MPVWIQGRELLEPPFNKTRLQVFKAVTEGRIVPLVDVQRCEEAFAIYERSGAKRLLPFPFKYDDLAHLRYLEDYIRTWISMSELEPALAEDGWLPKETPVDMEKFLVNAAEYLRHFDVPNRSSKELSAWFNKYYWRLFEVTGESIPEKRARLKKELERIERRMVELEQILDPKEVWDWALAMSPLEQERIIEMLLDAFYDAEEIEMWAQTGLDPEQEMPGLNPGAAQQPAKDSDNWRDQCQAYALGVLADRNPQPTRMALAEETKETLNVPRGIRTIMEYQQTCFTDYTSLKPGRKKGR